MAAERLNILRTLDGLGEPAGLKRLTEKSGLSLSKTLGTLQGLVKRGYVEKSGGKYSIAEKGKIALRVLNPLPKGVEFKFYRRIDKYTGVLAESLGDFLDKLTTIDIRALEFHVSRGDLENWILSVFGDKELAIELEKIRESGLTGESLKNRVSQAVGARYREFGWLVA